MVGNSDQGVSGEGEPEVWLVGNGNLRAMVQGQGVWGQEL